MKRLVMVLAALVCVSCLAAPHGLRTEYRENPFGLGVAAPRLSWKLPPGVRAQTAYEIEADGRTCGKVVSSAQTGVVYPGALGPRTRAVWRVRIWDEAGKVSGWSERATFSVANLTPADWGGARWIGTSDAQPPVFVRRFAVKGPVAEATLSVSAAGFYEASLNGARIGDKLLEPGFFDYDRRMLFSAYPLERRLKEGENELRVMLGHAWYDVRSHAAWDFDAARWRDRPKFILNLDIVYADGSRDSVVSDASWTTAPSPIVYDDIRDGEFIDPGARAVTTGVKLVTPPKGALVAASHPGTKVFAEHRPAALRRCADGRVVVDFGVNLAGWMRMRLRNLPKGRLVTFRYDERILPDGSPAHPTLPWRKAHGRKGPDLTRHIDEHLRVAGSTNLLGAAYQGFQTDRYTATGAAEETYEPRFTYNGFRYVVISGLDAVPDAADVTAVEISTDFPRTGFFRCSDETFNRLVEATDRAYRSNFTVAVPTDCPHREKNGWTGDAQLASELAQYLYENTSAYEKWIRDIVDAQNAAGDIPGIVPTSGWGYRMYNGPGWDAALTVVPWALYCYRGDVRALETAYPAVRRYLDFTAKKAQDGLVRHGLGDWCPANRGHMPKTEYTSSLFYYQAQTLAARMASVLNRPDEARAFSAGAGKTREAIVARYYRGDGVWDNGLQTAEAMALGFGIVPPGERRKTEARLVEAVRAAGGQCDFGIYGSKTVFRALSNAGYGDLAFKMIVARQGTSFGSWIEAGATTLWESWGGDSSRNHIMFGDFVAWAFQYLAGIRLAPAEGWADMLPMPTKPAFGEMLIAPDPVASLSFAEAEVETPYGKVQSRWQREGGRIRYNVTVPPGAGALFRAPGVPERRLGPGSHELLGSAPPGAGFAGDESADGVWSLKAGESRVLDFGPDGVGGYPTVAFAGTEGPTRIRLAYATHPDGLGPKGDFWHETRATYMGPGLWLPILPASTDRFDVFEQKGAGTWRAPLCQGLVRYAKLTVESGAATVRNVSFANDGVHSEEPVVGSFSCSDARVNGVWQASVRTCQLAAIPARMQSLAVRGVHTNAVLGTTYAYLSDGAKRDRLVWSGDLWFAQGNMYAAFAPDSPYMPGSIRMLAENRTPDGYVQACPFPESHGPLKAGDYGPFASDEFAAWFIPVLCDHVLHTGDLGLAREMRPVVRDLVAYLDRHTGADGIFRQRPETCKHSCGLAVGGTSLHHRSYMNILNWLAYRDAAELATWLGDAADAAAWTALADRTAQAVRREFWDAKKGRFRLSREDRKMGFEANALALAARFATPDEAKRILPQLTRNQHGKFQQLAIRGAFAYGQGEKAMALVAAHNWYKYLAPEWKGLRTVQECCGLGTRGWGDEAHPDACLAGVFTEGLLGVRPLEPGFRAFVVEPQLTSSVTSVSGSVPTPSGPVKVSVRDGHVTVTGNGGTGTIRWRGRTATVPPNGTVTL